MFLTMMTPLVYGALRLSAHRDRVPARPETDDREATVVPAGARHRPNLVKARRPFWLSRHNVAQADLS